MDPYTEYYREQAGGSWHDRIGPVYRASFTRQRGRGLGSIFRNIVSFVSPLFRSAWGALSKEALNTGANIMSDVASGDGTSSLKEVAGRRLGEARKRLLEKMKGSGRKRKRSVAPAKSSKRAKVVKRVVKKPRRKKVAIRTKADIFGMYK